MTIPLLAGIVTLNITGGSEISRHFIPEPDAKPALMTGVALIVALVALRRSRS